MTLIEFFDEEIIDNVAGTLLLRPFRTVFLYSGEKNIAFVNAMEKILARRKIETLIVMESIDIRSVESASSKIEECIKKYDDCHFDISGGNDIMLVAMGNVAKAYNLPMHGVNPMKNTVTAINGKFDYTVYDDAFLTVEELIMLHGGKVKRDFSRPETYTWTRDRHSENIIEKTWNVCKSDVGAWNRAIGTMKSYKVQDKNLLSMVWSKLKAAGLVYKEGNTVKYKSDIVKYLINKQGTALEMFTFIAAKSTDFFEDGQSSVVIDWKGRRDIENEIDVVLTKGLTGYFISCKNGTVDSDELYKLSIVSNRFGGKYAKKILVLSKFEPDMGFMNRAEELGIRVIKNVRLLSKESFGKKLIK
ncbi:MAG: Card1-like endonuclease domain-containing protein [Clostridia bacterium]